MKFSIALLTIMAAAANAVDVPSLNPENYDELTDGKTVLLKFFAPWCGHCKKMAPDWQKLSDDWSGHEVGFIGDVDCTTEGKPLCDAQGVKGFPSIKYGDPNALEDYSGARTYDALAAFAKDNLKPVCSPNKLDLCDDDKRKEIEGYMALESADLEAKIAAEEKKMTETEETFKAEVEKLQETYQKLTEESDAKKAEIAASGLGLMKSVAATMKKKAASNDEL